MTPSRLSQQIAKLSPRRGLPKRGAGAYDKGMPVEPPIRPKRRHIFIIDGTLSRIEDGDETNAGLLYKLLSEDGPQASQTVGYDPGVQASGLMKWINVAAGTGINTSIMNGYATLCSRYHAGDSILLFGYSRGAYAVRSLAGLIGRIGLIRAEDATERRIARAFRYYEATEPSQSAKDFCDAYCHADVDIDFLGVWDTVKSLGLPYPILNRLAPMATEFHDHSLLNNTRNAFQALALDENRTSYSPLPWRIKDDYNGNVQQVWFAGAHADIGGQIVNRPQARPLSNIPFVWMLERAESCGLDLPPDWHHEFPQNPLAPMHGAYRGKGRLFVARGPREVGKCSSETVHPSVYDRLAGQKRYKPRAILTPEKTESEKGWQGHIPADLQPE